MSRRISKSVQQHVLVPCIFLLLMQTGTMCVEFDFAGQLNLRGAIEDSESSGSVELRLMQKLQQGRGHSLTLHYEAVGIDSELVTSMNDGTGLSFILNGIPDDSRRVFDLTHIVTSDPDSLAYHRLDRLAFTFSGDSGSLTLGRSAITWGNGLVFNPMDLFNPFAPTDVERDYKMGDDLLLLTLFPADWNRQMEWQLLAVPRRSIPNGSLQSSESSLALKAHLLAGETEWDFLAAWHYDQAVLGLGRTGYIGDAVWRWDTTINFADDHEYFSTVANIDYSWTWSGINYYGSVEFHYNNVGSAKYSQLVRDTDLVERLLRGEMHTMGRAYMAPSLQVELHPLLNFHFAAVVNLQDPSAVLLPRFVWSARQDIEITLGGNLYVGGKGTEFGGIPIPGGSDYIEPQDRLYLWVKAYF